MSKNIFKNKKISQNYDSFYKTPYGKKVDEIEKNLCLEFTKKLPKTDMLELGCGTGHWSKFFIEQGFQLTATDISNSMLKIVKSKNLNAKILKANSENLPFKDNSFSLVSSITMIEFVKNQEKVISEINRVLKPNGYLLIACLNRNSILWTTRKKSKSYKNANFLTPEDFKKLLEKIGNVDMKFGVYINNNFEILNEQENRNVEPAFMLALVKK